MKGWKRSDRLHVFMIGQYVEEMFNLVSGWQAEGWGQFLQGCENKSAMVHFSVRNG